MKAPSMYVCNIYVCARKGRAVKRIHITACKRNCLDNKMDGLNVDTYLYKRKVMAYQLRQR